MKLRTLSVTGSLVINAALLGALALRPALLPAGIRDYFTGESARDAERDTIEQARLARVAPAKASAPRPKLWSALSTDDLPSLIARLRAAGFPPAIIREIIRRQVNASYDARIRALENPDPNLPFWKLPSVYFGASDGRLDEINRLYRERGRVLRDLLKDDALATDDVTAAQRRQFGNLSRQKIDQLQRLEDDYTDMLSAARAATNGITLPEDREKLALLNREKRADLAAILTPEELADYELRTSPTTAYLRRRLGDFDPSEAEFRALFDAQQALNQKFPGGGMDTQTMDMAQRRALQETANAQLLAALGPARYADYVRELDSQYQQLNRIATQQNIPHETALQAYGFQDSVARESNRIFDDPSLNDAQKRAALQTLAQTTRGQLLALLGSSAGPSYLKVANQWLDPVENGSAISRQGAPLVVISDQMTFGFGGGVSFRNLPVPAPAK